jgi:hypothetical protein
MASPKAQKASTNTKEFRNGRWDAMAAMPNASNSNPVTIPAINAATASPEIGL